jgi:4-amino-4-deoxy-L-arabinose transferase-like glycosyltransferase
MDLSAEKTPWENLLAAFTLAFIAALALLRLWLSRALPLTGDEAYHWVWSRHLDWGYYDHPPLTAWLIWLTTRLFGEGLVAVRLTAAVSGAVAALALLALARRLFGSAAAGLWSVAMLAVAPVFAGLGLLITTDPPLLAAWALSLYVSWRAAEEGKARWWALAGLCFGLAVLSKLIGLLLAPCFGLFLLLSRRHRRWLATPRPYLALALGLVLASPFFWWNAHHGWATFLFNVSLRHETRGLALGVFLLFWAGQLAVLSPLLFLALAGSAARAWRWARVSADPRGLFLLCFALPLLFFGLSSLYTEVGAHWPAVGYLSLILAASAPLGAGRWTRSYCRLRAWGLATAAVITAFFLLLAPCPQLVHPLIAHFNPREADKLLAEYSGWRELARRVARVRGEMSRQGPVFLTTPSYSLSSRLTYYLPGHPHVTVIGPGSPHGQNYAFWDDFAALVGQDALFVSEWPPDSKPEVMAYLRPAFERIEAGPPLPRRYRGRIVGHFYLLRCCGFRGITWQERLRPSNRAPRPIPAAAGLSPGSPRPGLSASGHK